MKKLLLVLLALPFIGFGQNVNIPDANFKAYLVGNTAINTNGDSEIQVSEAAAFTGTINCSWMNISNLTGIEAFTALTTLYCHLNQLSSLDVSQNTALTYLDCEYNQLSSLDVSQNTALTVLQCGGNQLSSLDVRNGNNTNFTYFYAFDNPYLYCISADDAAWATASWGQSNIDSWASFSNNCALEVIGCTDPIALNYNSLATIDDNTCFFQQTYVPDDNFEAYLEANGMGDGISGNDSVLTPNINTVTTLNVNGLNIADLTGIEAFTALTILSCWNNQLTNLDLSQNTALTSLNCHYNQIISLDFSNNPVLKNVDCKDNQLLSLDFSNNPALWWLEADNNNINSLNINGCDTLFSIMFNNNQLTNLNLSTNTNLIQIYCVNNQIDTLDFSNCTNHFGILEATNNNLSYLNLQNGHLASEVWIQNNPNLTCILIDSNEVINNFQLDPQHYFSNNCSGVTPTWNCSNGVCSDPGTGTGAYTSLTACQTVCGTTEIQEQTTNKELLKVTDLLGRETKATNQLLFYIYNDGTVEKKVVIE